MPMISRQFMYRLNGHASTLVALLVLVACQSGDAPTGVEATLPDPVTSLRWTIDGAASDVARAAELSGATLAAIELDTSAVVQVRTARTRSPAAPAVMNAEGRFGGLVIIDGELANDEQVAALAPELIRNITVLQGTSAQAAYPTPEAALGVIQIVTRTP